MLRMATKKNPLVKKLTNKTCDFSSLAINSEICGFKLKKITEFKKYNLTFFELKHNCGAKHIHVKTADPNNVFGIGFKTTPNNDFGIPHILEHCTLCGSRKYDCNDPFMEMLSRSINSYINAMTAHNWTFYTFRSHNEKDFRNLQSVYLDAVFFPKLKQSDFLREGSHVFQTKEGKKFGGVVFNEMKGVYSNTSVQMSREINKKLFSNSSLRFDSGGDPEKIPSVTHREIKEFYNKNYSPSNALFYSFGNFSLQDTLKFIEKNVFDAKNKISNEISKESTTYSSKKSFDNDINNKNDIELDSKTIKNETIESFLSLPPSAVVSDPEKPFSAAVVFLCNRIVDLQETFDMTILSRLLLDGQNSNMYKELIDTGICSDFSEISGYDDDTEWSYFCIALNSVSKETVENIESILDKTLKKIIEKGFEKERIESILHKYELSDKQITKNFGLHLGIDTISNIANGIPPTESFQTEERVNNLRKTLSTTPNHFENLCKKYFLQGRRKVVLRTNIDPNHESKLVAREQRDANSKSDELVKAHSEALESRENGDTNSLPSLSIKDIPRKGIYYHVNVVNVINNAALEKENKAKTNALNGNKALKKDNKDFAIDNNEAYDKIYTSIQPTNGVAYITISYDVSKLSPELKKMLPLLAYCMTDFGTENMNKTELNQTIDFFTGGISTKCEVVTDLKDSQSCKEYLTISSHCLEKNIAKMISIMAEVIRIPKFDDIAKLETNLKQFLEQKNSSLLSNGLKYATRLVKAHLNTPGKLSEQYRGLTQIEFLHSLVSKKNADKKNNHFEKILSNFDQIIKHLVASPKKAFLRGEKEPLKILEKFFRRHFTQNNQKLKESEKIFDEKSKKISKNMEILDKKDEKMDKKAQFLPLPLQCNFVVAAIETVPFEHEDYAALVILAELLSRKFLHKEIREIGNAYGSGATQSSGVFAFYSYRDPHFSRTLKKYSEAIDFACRGGFSDKDVEQAVLGVFSNIEAPESPYLRGIEFFRSGLTSESRQILRERLLGLTKSELKNIAEKYLLKAKDFSKNLIEKHNFKDFKDDLKRQKEKRFAVAVVGKKELCENLPRGWNVIESDINK